MGFRHIRRHYQEVGQQLSLSERWPTPVRRHTIIVPVAGLHQGVIKAVRYGQILDGDLRMVTIEVNWALKIALLYNRRDWRGRFRIITDVPFYLSK
jgi:hypothetical protein